jgi:hypothetical protein
MHDDELSRKFKPVRRVSVLRLSSGNFFLNFDPYKVSVAKLETSILLLNGV